MSEYFGLPTSNILVVLLAILGVALATVAIIALLNRTMFFLGLRNIPRRGLQTGLVVAGLTLSTLIVTSALVTGDTVNYSFTKNSYDLLQRTDISISYDGAGTINNDGGMANPGNQAFVDQAALGALETRFAGDPLIDAFSPVLYVEAPVTLARTNITRPAIELAGLDPDRQARAGGLTLSDGSQADLARLGPDAIFLSERAAEALRARTGDTVSVAINRQPRQFTVAGIVRDELASGVLGLPYTGVPSGAAIRLDVLQQLSGHTGQLSAIHVAVAGGVRGSLANSSEVRANIEGFMTRGDQTAFSRGPKDNPRWVSVTELKQDAIDQANLTSSLFTTFFLVLGLFSMAAGIMLIFMIFVMLAAERRAEMGMARAVGAQRRHIVQSFVSEGMAYSLLAGVVGAGLGILAGLGVTIGIIKLTGGDDFSFLHAHVTLKSVAIGYCLGVAVTFVTVVFASLKASHVNIVAAIRSLSEESRPEPRRGIRWRWLLAGVPALVIPPLGLWFILRKGLGLPKAWIFGPAGILFGVLFMLLGKSSEALFPFGLGISLIPLSAAGIARRFGAPNRATWTAVGVALAAYWLMPFDLQQDIFGKLDGNIEMFVLSGIMIVIAFSLVIVFNARLMLALFQSDHEGTAAYRTPALLAITAFVTALVAFALGTTGDGLGELLYLFAGLIAVTAAFAFAAARFPQLAPALKMAIAYPLANRFRTGMTIAMFSLIVFSLTVFSIMMANFGAVSGGDSARGGLDLVITAAPGSDIGDLKGELGPANPVAAASLETIGRVSLPNGVSEVRNPGDAEWLEYPVIAADDTFLGGLNPALDAWAAGFQSEADVLRAVREHDNLALVDQYAPSNGNWDTNWAPDNVSISDHRFEPIRVEVHDPKTGEARTVFIIGILKANLGPRYMSGIYLGQAGYTSLYGQPTYNRLFARVSNPGQARDIASGIEQALAPHGVAAVATQQIIDNTSASDKTFERAFQAFMALGLVVGIAGLGVIAFRSVVERRQQIGMLRAIGYQRTTVALTFLLESSFIAVMGIVSGVLGGAILGRNLMTSESMTEGHAITFQLPWTEILVVVAAAYVFSLLMTWWPSRDAARVPVADALRYE